MRLVLIICSGLWFIFGMIVFALGMSIVSLPENISASKGTVIAIGVIATFTSVYFLYITFFNYKHQKSRKCEASLIKNLLEKKFRVSIIFIAKDCSMKLDETQYYTQKRINKVDGLVMNEKGIIEFNKYLKNQTKKTKKSARKKRK